jgi:hypothetical protein
MRRSTGRHAWLGIGLALAALMAPPSVLGQIPEGFEMVRLTGFGLYSRPDINNRGEVIWSYSIPPDVSDLYLFKGGIIRKITNEDWYEHSPSINDDGDHAFAQTTDFFGTSDVVVRKNGEVLLFKSANASQQPDINNAGQVVWQDRFSKEDASDIRVFLFNGNDVQQITNNGISNQAPRINNLEKIVWDATDTAAPGNPSTIMLYDDGALSALTDNKKLRTGPHINDFQQVVWNESDFDGQNDRVVLWENGVATEFIRGEVAGPSINNIGDITYVRWNEMQGWWELWLHKARDQAAFMIPNQGFSHTGGPVGMNECGELAWRSRLPGGGNPSTVFLLRRVAPTGDFNHDCRIDAVDFSIIENCFTGNRNGPPDGLYGDCTRADFDEDGDVDETDLSQFMNAHGGPAQAVIDCQFVEVCGS